MAKKKKIEETTPIENAVEVNEEMDNVVELPEDEVAAEAPEEETEDRFVYVEDLGFSVLNFLNAEEIEAIADFVNGYTSWSDRYYAKGIATMNVATDLTADEVTNIVTEVDMIANPFVNTMYANILNWSFVEDAIAYYSSVGFKLDQIMNAINIAGTVADNATEADVKDLISNMRKDSDE